MTQKNLEVWTLEEMHKHWKADLVKLTELSLRHKRFVESVRAAYIQAEEGNPDWEEIAKALFEENKALEEARK